jgi:hypothetical protein
MALGSEGDEHAAPTAHYRGMRALAIRSWVAGNTTHSHLRTEGTRHSIRLLLKYPETGRLRRRGWQRGLMIIMGQWWMNLWYRAGTVSDVEVWRVSWKNSGWRNAANNSESISRAVVVYILEFLIISDCKSSTSEVTLLSNPSQRRDRRLFQTLSGCVDAFSVLVRT